MCLRKLLHYTDYNGIIGILQSSMIFKSKTGAYGPWLYLTDLLPLYYNLLGISFDCFGQFIPHKFNFVIEGKCVNFYECKITSRHVYFYFLFQSIQICAGTTLVSSDQWRALCTEITVVNLSANLSGVTWI